MKKVVSNMSGNASALQQVRGDVRKKVVALGGTYHKGGGVPDQHFVIFYYIECRFAAGRSRFAEVALVIFSKSFQNLTIIKVIFLGAPVWSNHYLSLSSPK